MQLEILVILAKLSNRTLVLPPKTKWWHLDELVIGDVWDVEFLGSKIPLLTASEWLALREKPSVGYSAFFKNLRNEVYGSYATPEISPSVAVFKKDFLDDDTSIWYFFCRDEGQKYREGNRMFGQFGCYYRNVGNFSDFISNSLRFRKKYYELAESVLKEMGLSVGEYNAIHVRNWESTQYKNIGTQKVIESIAKMDPNLPVLVLSKNLHLNETETIKPIMHKLVYPSENLGPTNQSIVDMLLAVPAKKFVGSPLSTYSTGIMEMRMRYAKLCPMVDPTPEFFDGKDRTKCSSGKGTQFDKIIVS
jgi:hypothetical protein